MFSDARTPSTIIAPARQRSMKGPIISGGSWKSALMPITARPEAW